MSFFYTKLSNVLFFVACFVTFVWSGLGQHTNPVERQVTNPITDTPNVNPIAPAQEVKPLKNKKNGTVEGGDGDFGELPGTARSGRQAPRRDA